VLEALLEGQRVLTPQAVQGVILILSMLVENYVRQVVEQVVDNHFHHQDQRMVMDLLEDLVVAAALERTGLLVAQMIHIQANHQLLHH